MENLKNIGLKLYKGIKKEKPLNKQKIKEITVGNFKIKANKRHKLESYLRKYPLYSRNFPRICNALNQKLTDYGIIDVGANIGDTLALLRSSDVFNPVYCIEGLDEYFDLLKSNSSLFNNIYLFKIFLGETSTREKGKIIAEEGTARTSGNDTEDFTDFISLDDFIFQNHIENIKVLKIDTDGNDFKIIRGGLKFIKKVKPVIFFEYDSVYLKEMNEDPFATFDILYDTGYNKAIYYDNFGRLLCSTDLSNKRQICQFYKYIKDYKGSFHYYDICLFHQEDDTLADFVINKEEHITSL
ncbi:MAG: FkbM family methyltransferase [Ignavibacteriae bacterium]|nr:FkbM family methyltransferase [Ignavibacteriota bacterium]